MIDGLTHLLYISKEHLEGIPFTEALKNTLVKTVLESLKNSVVAIL